MWKGDCKIILCFVPSKFCQVDKGGKRSDKDSTSRRPPSRSHHQRHWERDAVVWSLPISIAKSWEQLSVESFRFELWLFTPHLNFGKHVKQMHYNHPHFSVPCFWFIHCMQCWFTHAPSTCWALQYLPHCNSFVTLCRLYSALHCIKSTGCAIQYTANTVSVVVYHTVKTNFMTLWCFNCPWLRYIPYCSIAASIFCYVLWTLWPTHRVPLDVIKVLCFSDYVLTPWQECDVEAATKM